MPSPGTHSLLFKLHSMLLKISCSSFVLAISAKKVWLMQQSPPVNQTGFLADQRREILLLDTRCSTIRKSENISLNVKLISSPLPPWWSWHQSTRQCNISVRHIAKNKHMRAHTRGACHVAKLALEAQQTSLLVQLPARKTTHSSQCTRTVCVCIIITL